MPVRPLVTSYEQDLGLYPDFWHRLGWSLAGVGLLALPWVASARWLSVANQALVAIVGAAGLMILTGFAGQISLGHAAFLAVGAYTVAVAGELWHLPFWLGLPLAGFLAAAVGLAVGPFALRLKGLYLAIVTLGLLFLVQHTLMSLNTWTHGVSGIAVPLHLTFSPDGPVFGRTFTTGPLTWTFERQLYLLYLPITATAAWACRNLQRSNTGRAMMAVRDSDLAAAALGVSPARAKVTAFGLSSFLAGVAGAMFAWQQQYITIEPPFDLHLSVMYIAMIVLGGLGTTFGAIWGAAFVVVLTPLSQALGRVLPGLGALSTAQQATVVTAVVVCLLLIFEPLGLLGVWLRVKRYFASWPFSY